jgi:hypothetical protein
MSKPPRLTKLADRIVDAAVKLASDEEQDIIFRHAFFCQVGLPHSRQTERSFSRSFGHSSIYIQAGAKCIDTYHNKWVELPLPFGVKPRLTMFYIDSAAVKSRSRSIDTGRSFNDFGERIGISPQGKNFYELKRQMEALSFATITIAQQTQHSLSHKPPKSLFDKFEVWFDKDKRQKALWPGEITLSEEYYSSLLEHAVPIPLEAVKALTHSSLSLDLLIWAARRLPMVSKPERIPFVAFKQQFGQDYKELRDFRRTFLHAMRQVQTVYRDAKIETVKGGLLLKPSKPMVSKGYVHGHSLPLEPPKALARYLPTSELTERAIEQFRTMFPRLDVYACKAAFDTWLPSAPEQPKNYQRAFIGFAKSWGRQQR